MGPDYVDAMWRMLQRPTPDDYLIATGETRSLEYFVSRAFAHFGLDWNEHVTFNNSLFRPSDIKESRGNPTKAREQLGWEAKMTVDGVIDAMCEAARTG